MGKGEVSLLNTRANRSRWRQVEATELARQLGGALNAQTGGKEFAEKIAAAHEEGHPNSPRVREMDSHNNDMGIKIGSENIDASPQEIVGKVLDKLGEGKLDVIKKGPNDIMRSKEKVKELYDDGKKPDEKLYGEQKN